jgi:hypothetical protein
VRLLSTSAAKCDRSAPKRSGITAADRPFKVWCHHTDPAAHPTGAEAAAAIHARPRIRDTVEIDVEGIASCSGYTYDAAPCPDDNARLVGTDDMGIVRLLTRVEHEGAQRLASPTSWVTARLPTGAPPRPSARRRCRRRVRLVQRRPALRKP